MYACSSCICSLYDCTQAHPQAVQLFLQPYKKPPVKKLHNCSTQVNLSTRPEKSVGSDQIWEQAEDALRAALTVKGWSYALNEADGAFYGLRLLAAHCLNSCSSPVTILSLPTEAGPGILMGNLSLHCMCPEHWSRRLELSDP